MDENKCRCLFFKLMNRLGMNSGLCRYPVRKNLREKNCKKEFRKDSFNILIQNTYKANKLSSYLRKSLN